MKRGEKAQLVVQPQCMSLHPSCYQQVMLEFGAVPILKFRIGHVESNMLPNIHLLQCLECESQAVHHTPTYSIQQN